MLLEGSVDSIADKLESCRVCASLAKTLCSFTPHIAMHEGLLSCLPQPYDVEAVAAVSADSQLCGAGHCLCVSPDQGRNPLDRNSAVVGQPHHGRPRSSG